MNRNSTQPRAWSGYPSLLPFFSPSLEQQSVSVFTDISSPTMVLCILHLQSLLAWGSCTRSLRQRCSNLNGYWHQEQCHQRTSCRRQHYFSNCNSPLLSCSGRLSGLSSSPFCCTVETCSPGYPTSCSGGGWSLCSLEWPILDVGLRNWPPALRYPTIST